LNSPPTGAAATANVQGLGANWRQFALLMAVNAFVGGMVGLERSVLPVLGQEKFGVDSSTAVVSFIAAFALAKALANLVAGRLSERFSRRRVLIAGWLLGIPVPLLLIWAPSWGWVIAANLLLGVNQGLAWSMTVNMKMDLAGPARRGLALGLNEAAGYLAVAGAAFLGGIIAAERGLGAEPFYLGVGFAACGLALSVLFVKDTAAHVMVESDSHLSEQPRPSLRYSFAAGTWGDRRLVGISQAGFVNSLNDALAWGILPLFFVSRGLAIDRVAALAAMYPLVWAILQLGTGWLSDTTGRWSLIAAGMALQGAAISLIAVVDSFEGWLLAVCLLGAGTAMVYPTLLAATGDAVAPASRATALGVYRFWRDSGAIAGALGAGLLADALGFAAAIHAVAALTVASGIVAALTLSERSAGRSMSAPGARLI